MSCRRSCMMSIWGCRLPSLVTDNVFEGHAILIWSYSQDSAGDVVLLAYDPNEPNGDDVEIIFNICKPQSDDLVRLGIRAAKRGKHGLESISERPIQTICSVRQLWRPWERGRRRSASCSRSRHPGTRGRPSVFPPRRGPAKCLRYWLRRGATTARPPGNRPRDVPGGVFVGPGRLDVFIQDDVTEADHFSWESGMESWEGLNQTLLSYPAAASWSPGRLDVFGVLNGWTFSMGHRAFTNGAWEPYWESLGLPEGDWAGMPVPIDGSVNSAEALGFMHGAPFLSRPCACSWGPSISMSSLSMGDTTREIAGDIADRDAKIAPHVRLGDVDSGGERSRGASSLAAPPPYVPGGMEKLDLFVITSSRSLMHRWYANGAWSLDWEDLGAPPSVGFGTEFPPSPAACTWGNDRLDVFAVEATDSCGTAGLMANGRPGRTLSGPIKSDPCCVSWSESDRCLRPCVELRPLARLVSELTSRFVWRSPPRLSLTPPAQATRRAPSPRSNRRAPASARTASAISLSRSRRHLGRGEAPELQPDGRPDQPAGPDVADVLEAVEAEVAEDHDVGVACGLAAAATVPPSRGGSRLQRRAASGAISGWRSAMICLARASLAGVQRVPSG